MAKKSAEPKPVAAQPEAAFVDLMMVAADYVKSSGGIENAKKSLEDAGTFIQKAGGVGQATKALEVLQSLREKIAE